MAHDLLTGLDAFITAHRTKYEADLAEFVAIPSVSADPARRGDIDRMAKLGVQALTSLGFKAKIVQTAGNPVVFGSLTRNPTYRTVTIYNHLDVQPAARDDWQTDPFKMETRDGRYIGRGTTDDKGPALVALAAVRYADEHKLPLNFKIIWELEEEAFSPSFEEFLINQAAALSTDSIVVCDGAWMSANRPAVVYALRGIVGFELSLTTAKQDLHSGMVGGAARNPIGELCQVINQCYDADTGQVKIPGFYDDVVPPTDSEMDDFVASGFKAQGFAKELGMKLMRSYDTREVIKRIMAQPTFEVHGIAGGYTGPGIKTIVPPSATAKLSARLVTNQQPDRILELIEKFVKSVNPDVEFNVVNKAEPYLGQATGPYADAMREAVKFAFGKPPVFVRLGGTIGSVLSMKRHLKAPIVNSGISLPEDSYHGPNESFKWTQAVAGIKVLVHYFDQIARLES